MQGQSFAVYESDSEDDELEFLDSFVQNCDHFVYYHV